MTISISSPINHHPGHMARSTPISPVTDYKRHRNAYDIIRNDEIVDGILSFLNKRHSSSLLYSPVSSSRSDLKSQSIKQWVEGLPRSPQSMSSPFIPPLLPKTSGINYKCSASNSSIPPSFSVTHQQTGALTVNDEKIINIVPSDSPPTSEPPNRELPALPVSARNLVEKDLVPSLEPEPTAPLPDLPERNPTRLLAKRQTMLSIASESGTKRVVSVPDLKIHGGNYAKSPLSAPIISEVSSLAGQPKQSQTPKMQSISSVGELHFPLPPLGTRPLTSQPSTSENGSGEGQIICKGSLGTLVPTELSVSRAKFSDLKFRRQRSMDYIKDSNHVYHEKEKIGTEYEKKKSVNLSPHLHKLFTPLRESRHHGRSQSYATPMPHTTFSTKLYNRICTTPTSLRAPLSVPIVEDALEGRQRLEVALCETNVTPSHNSATLETMTGARTESVADLRRRDISSGIRPGTRRVKEKIELIYACRITGSEARLLTVRRRALSGTKINWLVEDNGMAVRGNVDGGRLLIRCFGETGGKLDFLTVEGNPIFRFQRTNDTMRSAFSLDSEFDKIYFSVSDRSWDCSARWEVTIFHMKHREEVRWQVSGDKEMRGLDIKHEEQTLAIVRESGDHQYKLTVLPYNNWCIITALATLFDEWRVSRVGLAL